MKTTLQDKKVAILVADGFEQIELDGPRAALEEAGATVDIVSPNPRTVHGVHHGKPAKTLKVQVPLARARPGRYDALLLPGGVMNPDTLRQDRRAVQFARAFFRAHKPVAAICHGPQLLIETGAVRSRRMTSYPSVQTDLKNAGAKWVNREVVEDQGLVTSRQPADIPAFNQRMIRLFARPARRGARGQAK